MRSLQRTIRSRRAGSEVTKAGNRCTAKQMRVLCFFFFFLSCKEVLTKEKKSTKTSGVWGQWRGNLDIYFLSSIPV